MAMDSPGDFFKEHALAQGRPAEFIARLDNYMNGLIEHDLPILFSPTHWALTMGMKYEDLKQIISRREDYYQHFRIAKKRGGYRYISAPNAELLKVQYWIKRFILDKLKFPEYLTSYQKKRSIIDNARFHVGKELVVKYDLRNFFEDVTQRKVYGLFRHMGYNASVAIDLAKACCIRITPQAKDKRFIRNYACLPQGAPTSPALSNFAGFKVDLRISKYAELHECSYSRYADDITISGALKNKLPQFAIQDILKAEGFTMNIRKARYIQSSRHQQVTGLSVNEKVAVPKKHRRQIHTHLHNCVRFGPYEHLKRSGSFKLNYREWLWGNILFIKQLHRLEAEKMMVEFHKINWL